MLFLSTWSDGVSGIMRILGQIWNGFFHLQFFGSGFTFGDLMLAIFFVSIGFSLLMFFSNHGGGSGANGSSSSGGSGGITYG